MKGNRQEHHRRIQVTLEAFYGVCCGGGGGMGSEETQEIVVSQRVFNALQKINETEIDSEEVEEAIEAGVHNLKCLHDYLSNLFYEMVTHYWLYEAYNDCWQESLSNHILADIKSGIYVEKKDEDCYYEKSSYYNEDSNDSKDSDNDNEEDNYIDYRRLRAYKDWLLDGTHDNAFVAERTETDIEGIRNDYEVQYTIKLTRED